MKKGLVLAVFVLLLAGAGWYLMSRGTVSAVAPAGAGTSTAPTLMQSYANSTYNFSLMMPADFAAQETLVADGSGGETVVLQNQAGDGIQIIISPFSEDTGGGYTLTKERILQDVPDLTITDEQPVNIGSAYVGLAFKSDNQAFGGASREVWFVFRGNLYQISTYDRLDPLLQAIFATWNFR